MPLRHSEENNNYEISSISNLIHFLYAIAPILEKGSESQVKFKLWLPNSDIKADISECEKKLRQIKSGKIPKKTFES